MSEYTVVYDECHSWYNLKKPNGEILPCHSCWRGPMENAAIELNRLHKLCAEFIYNETDGESYPPPIRE